MVRAAGRVEALPWLAFLLTERRHVSRPTGRKIGRPKTGIGPVVGVRLYPDIEADLDAWIARQPGPKPSRPEAIRRLIRQALKGK